MSIALAGCREPTAPEARNIARSIEKKFADGDLWGASEMFVYMGGAGNAWGMPEAQNEALHIVRDGAPEIINGFVLEETIIAPGGIGKPWIRRSVAGWPRGYAFALFAGTDAHPGTGSLLPADWERKPHKPFTNMFMHLRGDTLRSWVQHAGTLDISEGAIDRECGSAKELLPAAGHSRERVQCHLALFEVSLRGEFITRADRNNRALRSFHRRHRLEIPRQRLPGVRFVTTCPERPDLPGRYDPECVDPIVFWRDNAQYAPSLGVDVSQMEKLYWGGWYGQKEGWPGAAPSDLYVRWTIHTPDGRLIESGVRSPGGEPVPKRDLDDWLHPLELTRGTRRAQLIIPARQVEPDVSFYEVRVLHIEMSVQ